MTSLNDARQSANDINDNDLISEFDYDFEEYADEILDELLNNSGSIHNPKSKQKTEGLKGKLKLFPNLDFPVSKHSNYGDDQWVLGQPNNYKKLSISFNRLLPGENDLKRMLGYHLIPDFSPYGGSRSYITAEHKTSTFKLLDDYCFTPNHLDATPSSISLITVPMLNMALDAARDSGKVSHYSNLYYLIRFWLNLGRDGFIPEPYCLDIPANKVDTKERERDVFDHLKNSLGSWESYDEDELERLIEYAMFWIEKALPELTKLKDFIKQNKIEKFYGFKVQVLDRDLSLEESTTVIVDNIEIFKPQMRQYTIAQNNTTRYIYNFAMPYIKTIDKVRSALFILIALCTGARSRELCGLCFSDFYYARGEWWVSLTRFKVTNDPNYKGQKQEIPLPSFIGENLILLKNLKNLYKPNSDILFRSMRSSRTDSNHRVLLPILTHLKNETGLDSIHVHRFRKTIADIIINRGEANIDILRHLFGHKSYTMTLRYIARNPYIIQSVALAIEQNYSDDFVDVLDAVKNGQHSGETATRIANAINAKPEHFNGRQFKVTVFHYIKHLLESGEPIFIKRTALGVFCLSDEKYSQTYLPPCLEGKVLLPDETPLPDPQNCQTYCKHAVVTEKARESLQEDVKFYTSLLDHMTGQENKVSFQKLSKQLRACLIHLDNLGRSTITITSESDSARS
ncbi:tyrosine-type recombinase/integrase [Pseudomonas mandelii]|uniref:tyrosine-type recombinase/integrase n=1 Tax=Pseudomonas mandelii TaxID=75612 RepID=UPI00224B294E|nr:tyrosine-type recombinase/integrase [Pseudomonas mandelii]MCX2901074.1 tyrosine-type recombinase/integrase [Pseudomonas mandelii]